MNARPEPVRWDPPTRRSAIDLHVNVSGLRRIAMNSFLSGVPTCEEERLIGRFFLGGKIFDKPHIEHGGSGAGHPREAEIVLGDVPCGMGSTPSPLNQGVNKIAAMGVPLGSRHALRTKRCTRGRR